MCLGVWGKAYLQSSTILQRLCECLGLSEYEARIYLSLIEGGTIKATTLSTMSGVPRTKVYGVLRKLIDSGLAVKIPGEPMRFAPTPPRTAFKKYLDSYQGMVENILSIVSSLEETIKRTKSGERLQRGAIWIMHGREEILSKIREMLSRARRSVHMVTNEEGMVLLYQTFDRLFDDLAERSVEIKIATPSKPNNQHLLSELGYTCRIEESDFQLPLIFLCVDRKQLLLANLQSNTSSPYPIRSKAVFSDDPVLREIVGLLIMERAGTPPFQPVVKERGEIAEQ